MKKEQPTGTHITSGRLRRFLSRQTGPEHEQAFIRILIVVVILLYLIVLDHGVPHSNRQLETGIHLFSIHLLIGVFIAVWILLSPAPSNSRKAVGIITDIGSFSLAMIFTGEIGAPWWAGCLWITFGNGFRYGERFLYLSAILSVIGFSLALLLNDYWQANMALGSGLLIAMIMLPWYTAVLIKRLQAERLRAEEASRSKSDFLARMSHEIRTPLNGIIGTGELLSACRLGPEEREYVETINTSGHSLLKLIEDILDISKIEAGKLVIEQTDFDLHALLNSTIMMFSPEVKRKQLHLRLQIGMNVPFRLTGDPHHLRQILINLLSNAIKFTHQGSIELRLSNLQEEPQRARIKFEIIDTGVGMTDAAKQRIFENFAQADESTTRKFGGTGLGTSIAKQLVELMGGEIGCQSRVDVGTNFWFCIEFRQQQQWASDADLQLVQRCRVLRLCQDPDDDGVLPHTLSGWGVPLVSVGSSDEVLRQLLTRSSSTGGFNLLVIDLYPISDRLRELLGSLREELNLPHLLLLHLLPQGSSTFRIDGIGNPFYQITLPLVKEQLFNLLHISGSREFSGRIRTNGTTGPARENRQPVVQGLKILVAEDNSINRMVIGRILQQADYQHCLVENGQQLLDTLDQEAYDLVILDMHMPVLGGIDAFKAYRFAHASDKQTIPFIMLTANATVDAQQECQEAGIEYFLTKPVSASTLLQTIASATAHLPPLPAAEDPVDDQTLTLPETANRHLIDQKVVDELIDLAPDRDFMHRLLERLVEDGKEQLDEMSIAQQSGNQQQFREVAHALKGSAANMGLCRLTTLLRSAEQLPAVQLAVEGKQHIAEIRSVFIASESALARLLEYPDPGC